MHVVVDLERRSCDGSIKCVTCTGLSIGATVVHAIVLRGVERALGVLVAACCGPRSHCMQKYFDRYNKTAEGLGYNDYCTGIVSYSSHSHPSLCPVQRSQTCFISGRYVRTIKSATPSGSNSSRAIFAHDDPLASSPARCVLRAMSFDFLLALTSRTLQMMGCTIKLVGTAALNASKGQLAVFVSPVLVPLGGPLASARGPGNVVVVRSQNLSELCHCMVYSVLIKCSNKESYQQP